MTNAPATSTIISKERRRKPNHSSVTSRTASSSLRSFMAKQLAPAIPMVMLMMFTTKLPKAQAFAAVGNIVTQHFSSTTSSALFMSTRQQRGLEQKREGPTPTKGGMTLYCKAAADGKSIGDCPFAHYDRLVLEEKGLEYELKPTAPDAKPEWLLEYYEGKMPALRHRKECYVESSVIAEYLEYFFPEPSLSVDSDISECGEQAQAILDGFFPAVAKFLKDMDDSEETTNCVKDKLQQLEDHLASLPNDSFLCGTDKFTLLDCRIVPMLYHLQTGIEGFKNGQPNLQKDYPQVYQYIQNAQQRPSFAATVYPKETVLWGWGNARN